MLDGGKTGPIRPRQMPAFVSLGKPGVHFSLTNALFVVTFVFIGKTGAHFSLTNALFVVTFVFIEKTGAHFSLTNASMSRSTDLSWTITYMRQNNIESAAPLNPINRAAL